MTCIQGPGAISSCSAVLTGAVADVTDVLDETLHDLDGELVGLLAATAASLEAVVSEAAALLRCTSERCLRDCSLSPLLDPCCCLLLLPWASCRCLARLPSCPPLPRLSP